ncbi:MAG TPA: hypothetical protein VI564_08490 [Candidatus Nanoarchaeia archaeon]|nr:hypothetical protein [Candidatus Nanoarchaeia archaeon]
MKKSQIYGQVFIYVLAMVLVAFILIYGYNAIQSFKGKADEVCMAKLKSDLKNAVKSMTTDYGSVQRKDISLCSGFSRICLVENFEKPQVLANTDPIIKDSIASESENNVFLMEKSVKDSFYIGKISTQPDVLCAGAQGSTISLRLEGRGNRVDITEWN